MAGLTWLHLSDLHQKGRDFDRTEVRDALMNDIKNRTKISPDLTGIDFIIFSGDVAYRGKAEEYHVAIKEFFDPLLKVSGVGRDRLFIVPGNHDLDRDALDVLPDNLLETFNKPGRINDWLIDERKRRVLLEPMGNYSRFLEDYLGDDVVGSEPAFGYVRHFNVADKKVALIGINSAWLCARHKEIKDSKEEVNDYGYLIVGEPQLHEALSKSSNADVRIAVLHHPFEWLIMTDTLPERSRIRDHLEKECHFILHGHVHSPRLVLSRDTSGDSVIIPAGSSYDRWQPTTFRYVNGYNFVHLDFEEGQGIVYPRRYETRQGWIRDTGATGDSTPGVFRFPLPIEPSYVKISFELNEKTKFARKFFDKVGFGIKPMPDPEAFLVVPRRSLLEKRFRKGLYVSVWDTPLDRRAVETIYKQAKEHTDYAFVITNKQPKLDGLMIIASMRLNESRPFVLIPITDTVINEWAVSKNKRRIFVNYIEKYMGKGYNPYDVRDPVCDVLSFFGREGIIDEILDELRLGKRVGLFGLHKIGKSSVLKTLQKKVKFPVAYTYLKKNMRLNDIYKSILKAWEIDIQLKYPNVKWSTPPNFEISFESVTKSLLEHLEDVVPVPHLSVFLDEIEAIIPYKDGDEETLNCYVSLMDSLRGLQQETESLSLLVAGVHPKIARVNYFWGSQKNPMHQVIVEKFLPPLETNDCEVMIRSLGKQIGLDYDDETMEFILHKSGTHPYLARQLCSAAYQKHKETGVMPFEIVQEAAEEFVYNPSRNDYFNDNALWGELAKEDIWGKKICEVNHYILRKLATSEEGLSKTELSQGIQRTVFEQSFAALKERSIINLLPGTNRYQITFELFKDWIHAHKLDEKEVVWQTHSISELQSRTTNLSGVGTK